MALLPAAASGATLENAGRLSSVCARMLLLERSVKDRRVIFAMQGFLTIGLLTRPEPLLEREFTGNLANASGIRGRYQAEGGTVDISAGIQELRMVESVKELTTKLEAHGFLNLEVLLNR